MRLIDADALKKEWSMGLGSCDDCPQNTRRCQLDMDFTRMDICGMIDDAPTIGGWISVKDRMPPAGKVLLVARKYKEPGKKEIRYVEMGELMDDCTWLSDSDEYKINREYHSRPYAWMPLPEPPKEKNDDRT